MPKKAKIIYVSPAKKKAQKKVQEKPVKKRNKKQAVKDKMEGMRQEKQVAVLNKLRRVKNN